ncbi:hypothetical protein QDX81_20685 [Pseudomonas sp. CW003PS]|nr:hypothetical protein QDX81_20685 [Pseudomonas sp. CW003PS]
MAARITDDEWDELTPENFDTTALLRAVDAVCGFHADSDTHSTRIRTVIPR